MQKIIKDSPQDVKKHLAELKQETELLRQKLAEMSKKHNLKSNLN